MQTKPFNPEVLYPEELIVKVHKRNIQELIEKAKENDRRRIRLCSHQDVDDAVHEMLIVHEKGAYVRPHKHLNRMESFHIIEGSADVILFNDAGDVTDVISMGDYSSGRMFYYRMNQPFFHTLLIESETLVFHEVTRGPFNPADTEFASWAPKDQDKNGVKKFISHLKQLLSERAKS